MQDDCSGEKESFRLRYQDILIAVVNRRTRAGREARTQTNTLVDTKRSAVNTIHTRVSESPSPCITRGRFFYQESGALNKMLESQPAFKMHSHNDYERAPGQTHYRRWPE
ncbi:hypothetical protein EYF80_039891 [Liparis tanakae]|uniref:Uncharacterized protein n=1 Tax=Liparis tanakae TaxID=230148 RepID=A0A4Z2G9H1_9TELE|nr:hypothetical protein EYF80_039891 [Liparis tanakae]